MVDPPEQPATTMQGRTRRRGRLVLLIGLIIVVAVASSGGWLYFNPGILAPLTVHPTTSSIAIANNSFVNAPMFGTDAQHTHFNAAEHLLTYKTVAHLVPDWTSPATGGSLFSSPVVANGVVYVGSLDSVLYAFAAAGCSQPSCPPLWTSVPMGDRIYSSPAVADGIVYIASFDHKLYAFNAHGCGKATCRLCGLLPQLAVILTRRRSW